MDTNDPKPRAKTSSLVKAGMVSSCGIEFALAAGLFTWAGKYADARFGTEPALVLVGFFLGLIVGFASLMRAVKRLDALEADEKK